MASTETRLKIIFFSMDGVGHVNACIGLAQALANRCHEICFLTRKNFAGTYERFGFKELIWGIEDNTKNSNDQSKIHPLKAQQDMLDGIRKSPFLSNKSPIEKLTAFGSENDFMKKMSLEIQEEHPKIKMLIEQELPDLIIVDHFIVAPCIAYGQIPWAFLFSGNPAFFFESPDIPPVMSGYSSNDRTGWDEFREKFNNTFKFGMRSIQNSLNKNLGYPEVDENQFLFKSKYMNIYGYPEELDYTDLITLPQNFVRLDAFCRDTPETFELPAEFKEKIKSGDKLIYLSMGSMGSIDVNLMKKLVAELSQSSHKFIVSMGAAHDEYKLADNNMWGKAFLPQTKIIPLVDLVITHGGNNTVTETFSFGKPMIAMPLFADQYDNAQRIKEKGFGDRLDPYSFNDGELRTMVDRILNDKAIRDRCERASLRMSQTNSKKIACEKIEKIIQDLKNKKS
ncbi:NDP-glycosyltransferase YjiC-like [Dermatophagoides farinae]|uniref:NDP-glycosyltransferase YjiC-like n=1 Tax=Dermatophagoides farinae TaxID=6954 RepID=UPI003F6045F2